MGNVVTRHSAVHAVHPMIRHIQVKSSSSAIMEAREIPDSKSTRNLRMQHPPRISRGSHEGPGVKPYHAEGPLKYVLTVV